MSFPFKRLLFVVLQIGLLVSFDVKAEKVVDGEFVIETFTKLQSSVFNSNSDLSLYGLKISSEIDSKVKVINKKKTALKATSGVDVGSKIYREVTQEDYTFCDDLVKNGIVKSCSPNFQIKINSTPNDPRFDEQWGLGTYPGIEAATAWNVTTGSKEVVVAILDTGIDYKHPDLIPNLWVNNAEIPGNGVDDDNNGYIDDVYGMSAIEKEGNPYDKNGHGTHVAGIIGASADNNIGVAGINWNVKLMSCRFLDEDGVGNLSGAIEALNYAVAMKKRGVNVVVVNNSWGGNGYSSSLHNKVVEAIQNGISVVAAAGNESVNNDITPTYPANFEVDEVISVAALNKNQDLASFSNYGAKTVDIAAPGVSIISTYKDQSYRSMSGTSMATPFVSGAVALLKSIEPNLSPAAVKSRLLESGTVINTLSNVTSSGRTLNLKRLVFGEGESIEKDGPTSSCSYGLDAGSFTPYKLTNTDTFLMDDDEVDEYKTISLPFKFPFFAGKYSTVTVSPNGVAYFQGYQTFDYRNAETAPAYSIAALHTDIYYPETGVDAVRVAGDENHYTISWIGNNFQNSFYGRFAAHLTLYPSGQIDLAYDFDSDEQAAKIARTATVGIRGANETESVTYSYNQALLYQDTKIRFLANCGTPTQDPQEPIVTPPEKEKLAVSKLQISALNARGKVVKMAIPNQKILLNVKGEGTGEINLNVLLNDRVCASPLTVKLNSGNSSKKLRLPNAVKRYNNITVSHQTLKSNKLRIKSSSAKARSAQFAKDCRLVLKKMSASL